MIEEIDIADIQRKRGNIIVKKIRKINVINLERKLDVTIGGNNIAEIEQYLTISNTEYPLGRDVLTIIKKCINDTLQISRIFGNDYIN